MPIGIGTAILAAGGIGALGSLFGGSAAAKGSKEASRTQLLMFGKQMELYREQLERLGPYREFGERLLPLYEQMITDPELSEMFKIRQEEGEEAINRALGARGMFRSGVGLKLLSDFNRRLLAEEGERQFGRLSGGVGLGFGATAQAGGVTAGMAGAAGQYGANVGNIQQGLGQVRGGQIAGVTGEIGGGLSGFAFMKALRELYGGGGGGGTTPDYEGGTPPVYAGGWMGG